MTTRAVDQQIEPIARVKLFTFVNDWQRDLALDR